MHKEKLYAYSTIDAKKFVQIIKRLLFVYNPIANTLGATLVIDGDWNNPLVNTYAKKEKHHWYIKVFGGLAKRPEMMADTLTLAICHEIGHLLGGWPYINAEKKIAAEGQADYFATQHCLNLLWDGSDSNERYVHMTPIAASQLCDKAWQAFPQRAKCYRIMSAAYSLTKLMAKVTGQDVDIDLLPEEVAEMTLLSYPSTQCRLETMIRGALCRVQYQPEFQHATSTARILSALQHCSRLNGAHQFGRPPCWFAETDLF